MPILPESPTLSDFQRYVVALEEERGFAHQSALDKCLLLGEEVGELFKAVRKTLALSMEEGAEYGAVPEELADVLIYVCAIANRFDVDLERAFREKEAVNERRKWLR